MKIINKNEYKIMYGFDFINAGEVKDMDDKTAKHLLNHPNVEEYADKKDFKKLEEENKKLKEQLAKKEEPKKAKK